MSSGKFMLCERMRRYAIRNESNSFASLSREFENAATIRQVVSLRILPSLP